MKKILPILLILCSTMLWANGNREVTEEMTTEVTISYPVRIVSLSPSTTETLFAIGAGDQVVGVTSYCNYPAEAATREIIGGFSAKTISVETIISLNPDLVIADITAHQPIAETLKEAGITVLSIQSKSIEDILAAIEELAIITGNGEEGKKVADDIKIRIESVEDKINTLKADEKISVFYEVWDAPLMTAGPESFIGQLIQIAGGVNIFSDVEGDYPQISSEELISRNPQALLASDSHGEKLTPEAIQTREGWENIDAVKNNNIILINGDISSRPGPRVIDAIEIIASSLYPELFK